MDDNTIKTHIENVKETTMTVRAHCGWHRRQDDIDESIPLIIDTNIEGGIMYFNAVHEGYSTLYYPVEDICDIGNEFVMYDELCNIVEDTASYYVSRCCDDRFMIVNNRADIEATISSFITSAKGKNKRRKWVKFTEVFPDVEIDRNSYRDHTVSNMIESISHHGMHGMEERKFAIEWRKPKDMEFQIPHFCLIEDITPYEERKTPKRIIYKLGKTRGELRDHWTELIDALNGILSSKGIPMKIPNHSWHNIDTVIKFTKKQGITVDHVIANSWIAYRLKNYGKDTDAYKQALEHSRMIKALYRSPTKYKIIPKRIEEEAEKEKAKKEVDTTK